MAFTKAELVASLQNEVRLLLHLAAKIDPSMLDYRPAPKQRTTMELLRYLSMMGTGMLDFAFATNGFDTAVWQAEVQAANARDFDQTLTAIAAQSDKMAAVLDAASEGDLRAEMKTFDGQTRTRAWFIVNSILSGFAAYRMQLFLYLKACGRDELNTSNLWRGVDPQPATVS
jgi:hypothetical protein